MPYKVEKSKHCISVNIKSRKHHDFLVLVTTIMYVSYNFVVC